MQFMYFLLIAALNNYVHSTIVTSLVSNQHTLSNTYVQYRSIITSFLHTWQHTIFCMQNAKVCHGSNNFYKISCGIFTRRDVEFP